MVHQAYILYRELDYFEQLAALEQLGHFDLDLIKLLSGELRLLHRWDLWQPSIEAMGANRYPLFKSLAKKVEREIRPPTSQE